MHRILVPVDASASALAGVRHAIRVATERGDAIVLLVNAQPVFHRHIAQFVPRASLEALRAERGRGALREAERLAAAAEVPFRAFVVRGEPAAAVTAVAIREQADEIVLGTTPRSAWLRALTGSLPARIVERSPLPVALVPGPPATRLERWGIPAAGAGLAALLLAAE